MVRSGEALVLSLVWLVPALPLAAALALGLGGRRMGDAPISIVAVGALVLSFALSVGVAVEFGRSLWSSDTYTSYRTSDAAGALVSSYEWMPPIGVSTDAAEARGETAARPSAEVWGLEVDALSALMLLVVTGVGLVVFVYATGYMRGDPGYWRFFACMSFLAGAMLVLVLASSLALLFVAWEGVGLASYLLIGFWYERGAASDAARKAFVVNRVGDAPFLLGLFALFAIFGTLDVSALRDLFAAGAATAEPLGVVGPLGLAAIALFAGVAAKSAQIPLLVWLPDAIAAPTPVSAFIHAASTVTAGVFVLARLDFLFAAVPTVLIAIAAIGAATALVGAAAAAAQVDAKRLLAYSTISQLGLMVMACGAGAYAAAIFHVVTHACAKALLFLGVGSISHALAGEQRLEKMGGLRARMPVTYLTTAVGALAIAGVAPLGGFFSQDAMLAGVWTSASLPAGWPMGLWLAGLGVTLLTGFYTWRLVLHAFYGEPDDHEADGEARESPRILTLPLVVLATLAIVAGLGGVAGLFGTGAREALVFRWLAPATGAALAPEPRVEAALAAAMLAAALAGIGAAYLLHARRRAARRAVAPGEPALSRVDRIAARLPAGLLVAIARVSRAIDERAIPTIASDAALATNGASRAVEWLDRRVVDASVSFVAALAYYASLLLRALQTGIVQTYALVIVLGLAALWLVAEWPSLASAVARIFGG